MAQVELPRTSFDPVIARQPDLTHVFYATTGRPAYEAACRDALAAIAALMLAGRGRAEAVV